MGEYPDALGGKVKEGGCDGAGGHGGLGRGAQLRQV